MGMKISLLSTDFILISCVPNSGLCLTSLPKCIVQKCFPGLSSALLACSPVFTTVSCWLDRHSSAVHWGSRKSDTSLKTAFASQGLLLFWLGFIIDFQFL